MQRRREDGIPLTNGSEFLGPKTNNCSDCMMAFAKRLHVENK